MSWGSSSTELRRRIRPIGVRRSTGAGAASSEGSSPRCWAAQAVSNSVGGLPHGAELEDVEVVPVEPDAALAEEDRPG